MRKVSTLERHERAISISVVSKALRTRRVAVVVRWKALSVRFGQGLISQKSK